MTVSWRRSAPDVAKVGGAVEVGRGVNDTLPGDLPSLRLAPHWAQNLLCAGLACPQAEQERGSDVPHWPQNLLPSGTIALQLGHCIAASLQVQSPSR